jgi:thiamine-monophosphate kinase
MKVFASNRRASVGALGEVRLIESIRRWLGSAGLPPPLGLGDDCAVLPPSGRRKQLLTVDPVVYGRHFDDSLGPGAAGAKLLKRNLSDVAAMGGRPTAAVIALALDSNVDARWLEAFYRRLAACARGERVGIVGGDVTEAPGVFVATLTLLGEIPGPRALARAGAQGRDWIYVTGVLGNSFASGHHASFSPRLAEGVWLAARPAVRAMIDVSDGLAKDLPALTPRGCAPALIPAAIPRRRGASLADALGEGEDYELLFALAGNAERAEFEAAWRRAFPKTRISCIGRFLPRRELPADALDLGSFSGYEHLRASRR